MNGMTFGKRAGQALEDLVPEKDRDKALSRKFGVTPRVVRYLRNGKCWTVERLLLASSLLGKDFDRMLMNSGYPDGADGLDSTLEQRLERIEAQLAELLTESRRLRGD